MQVTIKVAPDVAPEIHKRHPATAASEELVQAAEELGVVLEPMHPGAENPHLAPYFTVEVRDPVTAARVIARLRQCRAIDAAYVKPPDELP